MLNRSKRLLSDTLMILFVIVFPHVARLPMFIYPAVVLLVLWAYLRWRRQTFSDIGFRWKDISFHAALIGALVGTAWAVVVMLLLGPLLVKVIGLPPADLHDFYFIRQSNVQFIQLLIVACFWVIPYEEIIFRGFVFTTTRKWFSFWFAGLITSLLFAMYHWQEGVSAVIGIFLGAMISVLLYRRFNGNLWYIIFFHIAYDVIMLSLLKLGYLD